MRKIAIVTSSRADYGLLFPLLNAVRNDVDLELQLIVTGMHLSPEFGSTYKNILNDGFSITYKVEMLLSADSPQSVAKAIGLGVIGFTDALTVCAPDILVLLGDRYEILAAAISAMPLCIPVAHIHGGEVTSAMIDDPVRHCLTKLSHFHFPAADEYAKRICQLGEPPESVFAFGAIGLDYLDENIFYKKNEVSAQLDFKLTEKLMVITYHPVTLQPGTLVDSYDEIFTALEQFNDYVFVFTCSNADYEGRLVFNLLKDYQARSGCDNVHVFTTLGYKLYMSLVKLSSLVLGNSSSGLIEVPYLGVPTVNIGDRQKGRLRASSVIDCNNNASSISKAIHLALSDSFQLGLERISSPYKKGGVAEKIKFVLKNSNLDFTSKLFVDTVL